MAYSALLEHIRFMSVDFREPGLLMTVETAALEDEASPRIESVALRALDIRNRRMLVKRLVTGGGIGARKKLHFFPAALPRQNYRMQAGRYLQRRVKNVRKRLLRLKRGAIELQLAGLGCGNQVDRARLVPRVIGRTHNFPVIAVRGRHSPARQNKSKQSRDRQGAFVNNYTRHNPRPPIPFSRILAAPARGPGPG